jgi:hypothetical protein
LKSLSPREQSIMQLLEGQYMNPKKVVTAGELVAALLDVLEQLPPDKALSSWTAPDASAAELQKLRVLEQRALQRLRAEQGQEVGDDE